MQRTKYNIKNTKSIINSFKQLSTRENDNLKNILITKILDELNDLDELKKLILTEMWNRIINHVKNEYSHIWGRGLSSEREPILDVLYSQKLPDSVSTLESFWTQEFSDDNLEYQSITSPGTYTAESPILFETSTWTLEDKYYERSSIFKTLKQAISQKFADELAKVKSLLANASYKITLLDQLNIALGTINSDEESAETKLKNIDTRLSKVIELEPKIERVQDSSDEDDLSAEDEHSFSDKESDDSFYTKSKSTRLTFESSGEYDSGNEHNSSSEKQEEEPYRFGY